MKILNLTQHAATPEQVEAGVVDLPQHARNEAATLLTFEQLPDRDEITVRAKALVVLAFRYIDLIDVPGAVMIGGAPWLMSSLERHFEQVGIRCVYAFSRRESVEQMQPDGSVRKVNVFRHAGFVCA